MEMKSRCVCVCVCDPSTRINIYTYIYFVVVHENRGTHVYRPIVSTVWILAVLLIAGGGATSFFIYPVNGNSSPNYFSLTYTLPTRKIFLDFLPKCYQKSRDTPEGTGRWL